MSTIFDAFAYSLGFISPASTLRYGSILMDDTWLSSQHFGKKICGPPQSLRSHIFIPAVLSNRPVEEAVTRAVLVSTVPIYSGFGIPIIPFPIPLMTPVVGVNTGRRRLKGFLPPDTRTKCILTSFRPFVCRAWRMPGGKEKDISTPALL